jgi:hypothetical protein
MKRKPIKIQMSIEKWADLHLGATIRGGHFKTEGTSHDLYVVEHYLKSRRHLDRGAFVRNGASQRV